MTLADLSPASWVKGADRTGHLLVGRAERFYYDLRVVYEIESRLKQLRGQPNQPATGPEQQRETPKSQPANPNGGGATEWDPPGPPVLGRGEGCQPSAPPARLCPGDFAAPAAQYGSALSRWR